MHAAEPSASASAPTEAAPGGFEARAGAEQFTFQAEVSRLMDIIINSLYSNKDIFLRELISNASDALDKIRFLSLSDPAALGEGDQTKLEMFISLDKEKKILRLRDTGIGMTKEHLKNNLGTIAKSGTSAFLEQMQKGGDMNLIGQFGVGFYSVYLVADYVEVVSKHNDDEQHVWESKADGNFAISRDTAGEPLGRGTLINIHVKDEASEYLDMGYLEDLVHRYSEFINFPIYLEKEKEVETEVEVEVEEGEQAAGTAEEAEEAAEGEAEEEEEAADDTEGEEAKPKTKIVKTIEKEWERVNDSKAIWLRDPKEVTPEDYAKFYKALSRGDDEALLNTHFKAEGDVEFKAVLFIPKTAPPNFLDHKDGGAGNLKLYVRRVFISDEFQDLLPRYLQWLLGIVDSDTLPLNVSREMLQQHSSLKTIKKKLVRKALDMVKKLADKEKKAREEDEDDTEEERKAKREEQAELEEQGRSYKDFWGQYSKAIKLGIIEDMSNRNRLAKLLRFHTSASGDELVSLEQYTARMKDQQEHIFFVVGSSVEDCRDSPFVEKLLKKGYEVIFFIDSLDEYVTSHMPEFEDFKFQNVSKEDLAIADDDAKREKRLAEAFKDFGTWWKDLLPVIEVDSVKVTTRLETSPLIVVTSKYGWSANMERMMKSQAFSDSKRDAFMRGKRTVEINPNHPIIQTLKEAYEADKDSEETKNTAILLYNTALINSGFAPTDIKAYTASIFGNVKSSLKIPEDAPIKEYELPPEEEPEPEPAPADEEPAPATAPPLEEQELDPAAEPGAKEEL